MPKTIPMMSVTTKMAIDDAISYPLSFFRKVIPSPVVESYELCLFFVFDVKSAKVVVDVIVSPVSVLVVVSMVVYVSSV